MTYAVHYQQGGRWLVEDFTEQHQAQRRARETGGFVHVVVSLHRATTNRALEVMARERGL